MDNQCSDRVLAFDSLFTTNHIQILKILLGYMEPSIQGKLAVYIKFRELQYTLQLIREHPSLSSTPNPSSGSSNNMAALLDEIIPLCSPTDRDKILNIKNMFHTMENMQEMMQMIELLQEISPELFQGGGMGTAQGEDGNNTGNGGMDFMQILNMLQGTDLSQMSDMMNMMQGMFGGDEANI